MVWDALGRAGWLGEKVDLRTIVFLRIRVGFVLDGRPSTRSTVELLPGTERKRREKGWVDDDHMACQTYEGPLNARAAGPGYRLAESERRPEDLEFGEDTLYTAAIRACWLSGDRGEVADVPDVHITVGVTSRQAELTHSSD